MHRASRAISGFRSCKSRDRRSSGSSIPWLRSTAPNWELSADRANAARRALVAAGLPESKINRIVGLADSAPINRADPLSPINRRISIIVMNQEATAVPEGLADPVRGK